MVDVRTSKQPPYQRLGGADGVRQLVECFYDLVETEAVAEPLRLMHLRGHGIAHSRIAQFEFMSGFLGGPRLYFENNRHADVRQMHAHLAIDAQARDAWIGCMKLALDQCRVEPDLADTLMGSFTRVAHMLQNIDDTP